MRGSAAQKGVAPEVAVARIPLSEAVMDEAQPCCVYRLPDRMQVGMVQRVVKRQVDVHPNGPRRATPALDLLHGRLDISGLHADHRLEPVRVFAAEVVQETMLCPHEL